MNAIIANEGLNVTEEGKDALLELSGGDMRRVLNVMQVKPLNVHNCPLPVLPGVFSRASWCPCGNVCVNGV